MELTLQQLQNYCNQCSISYYVGRKVPLTAKNTPASYYNGLEDNIVISLQQVNKSLSELVNEEDIVILIRTMIYHEVSHAILTSPIAEKKIEYIEEHKDLKYLRDVINIVEDARIEYYLNKYFIKVDFRKLLNSLRPIKTEYENALDLFFDVVRHRHGPEALVNQAKNLISSFSPSNLTGENYYQVRSYCKRAYDLYLECEEYFEKQTQEQQEQQESKSSSSEDQEEQNNQESEGQESEEQNQEQEEQIVDDYDFKDSDEDEDIFRKLQKEQQDIEEMTKQNRQEYQKLDLKNIQRLFNNSSTSSRQLLAGHSYSGKIDPRSIKEDTYKWFVKSGIEGDTKRGKKYNLILVIDISGSFSNNENLINNFLYTLHLLRKQYNNFSFKVIHNSSRGTFLKDSENEDMMIECAGGNDIDKDFGKVIEQAKEQDKINKVIVLYDGDCLSDYGAVECRKRDIHRWELSRKEYDNLYEESLKNLQALNNQDTYIISDSYNKQYFDTLPKATIKYTSSYSKDFINLICTILQNSIRF